MVKMFKIALFVLCIAAVAGCRSTGTEEGKELKTFTESDKQKTLALADQYADDIINGLQKKDRDLFIKNFVPDVRKQISNDVFNAGVENIAKLGKLTGKKYLAELNKSIFLTYVWKLQFVRVSKDAKTNQEKKTEQDMLFVLAVCKLDNKYYVASFNFL